MMVDPDTTYTPSAGPQAPSSTQTSYEPGHGHPESEGWHISVGINSDTRESLLSEVRTIEEGGGSAFWAMLNVFNYANYLDYLPFHQTPTFRSQNKSHLEDQGIELGRLGDIDDSPSDNSLTASENQSEADHPDFANTTKSTVTWQEWLISTASYYTPPAILKSAQSLTGTTPSRQSDEFGVELATLGEQETEDESWELVESPAAALPKAPKETPDAMPPSAREFQAAFAGSLARVKPRPQYDPSLRRGRSVNHQCSTQSKGKLSELRQAPENKSLSGDNADQPRTEQTQPLVRRRPQATPQTLRRNEAMTGSARLATIHEDAPLSLQTHTH